MTSEKIKCIIIDDEPLGTMLLEEMLKDAPVEILDICNDGYTGLKSIEQHQPDLIFLDIQMPKLTGIEMLELIENPPMVIFTTAYDEYAIKAFEINAIDYLLKPFDKERLLAAIEKVKARNVKPNTIQGQISTPETSERIVIKNNGNIDIISVKDVYFIESAGDYVKIYTKDKRYIKHGTMNHFEQAFSSKNFIRAHRSFLVNSSYIHKMINKEDGQYLILKNKAEVAVSKSGYAKLKEWMG